MQGGVKKESKQSSKSREYGVHVVRVCVCILCMYDNKTFRNWKIWEEEVNQGNEGVVVRTLHTYIIHVYTTLQPFVIYQMCALYCKSSLKDLLFKL